MLSINAFLLRTQQLDSSAIETVSTQLTYSSLKENVLAVAGHLQTLNIQEGDNVALLGNNDPEYIINILALWQLKAVPVLINPRLTSEEIELQLETVKSKVLLSHSNNDIGNFSNAEVTQYPFTSIKKVKDFDSPELLKPESTAVIIFTSGASGKPKGVELSFNNLIQSAKISDQLLEYSKDDRWLASLPFNHIAGLSIITRSLLFGSSICIPDELHTDNILRAMENFKPTLCSLVPTQLKRIIEISGEPNEELRSVLLGGGYVFPRLVTDAINSGWNIVKVYGATETSSLITALNSDEAYERPTSVGKALKPNDLIILGEGNVPLPWGEIGEIAVASPSIMKGYYSNESATRKKYNDDHYLTGDIGYMDADGYLYVEARRTDLIVTGGENVNPNEVENRIIEHPDISDVAVFPLADDDWGELVSASIVMKNGKDEIQLDELEQFLKKDLAGFKIPKKIFFEESLPVNDLGKIIRSKLVEKYTEE